MRTLVISYLLQLRPGRTVLIFLQRCAQQDFLWCHMMPFVARSQKQNSILLLQQLRATLQENWHRVPGPLVSMTIRRGQ